MGFPGRKEGTVVNWLRLWGLMLLLLLLVIDQAAAAVDATTAIAVVQALKKCYIFKYSDGDIIKVGARANQVQSGSSIYGRV